MKTGGLRKCMPRSASKPKSFRRRFKKVVKPSRLKEMAEEAVKTKGVSMRLACAAVGISETCYRYRSKLRSENAEIADWLTRLTDEHRSWGFGLCFLRLRNVRGFEWNHKRVYRLYKGLELNLRIKPKRRLDRECPKALAVPEQVNDTWSMDFMHDQLQDREKRRRSQPSAQRNNPVRST